MKLQSFLIFPLLFILCSCSSLSKTKDSATALGRSLYAPTHYIDKSFFQKTETLKISESMGSEEKKFLLGVINTINFNYSVYVANLTSGKAAMNVTYDSLNLALTGGAAIATPAATKTGLAALGTFFQGQKQSVDKNIFNDQAVFALTSIMEVRRAQVIKVIRASLKTESYTLGEALIDVDEYYRAGSMQNAMQASFLNQAKPSQESALPASTKD